MLPYYFDVARHNCIQASMECVEKGDVSKNIM